MKRWTLRIIVCLILITGGAITTVALAWGCVLWSDLNELFALTEAEAESLIVACDVQVFQHDKLSAAGGERGLGLSITQVALDASQRGGTSLWSITISAGFPFPSFFAEWRGTGVTTEEVFRLKQVGGWRVPESMRESGTVQWLLPYTPIWPGFLIDTLFYAAIWFGVFFGFVSAKRAIRGRRRRGRCPRCGYDLRGNVSAGCSECGHGRARLN